MNRRYMIGTAIAGIMLGVLLWLVDLPALGRALLRVSVVPLIVMLAIKLCGTFVKALRWSRAIAAAAGTAPRQRVFAATVVGLAGNIVLPARLGEVARMTLSTRHNQLPWGFSVSGAAVAYLLDALLLGLCLLLVLPRFLGDAAMRLITVALVIGALASVTAVLLTWLARSNPGAQLIGRLRSQSLRVGPRRLRRVGARVQRQLEGLLQGFRVLRQPGSLGPLLFDSLLILAAEVAAMHYGLQALGLALPWSASLMLVGALQLSYALPLTPGNLGTHQLVSVAVLRAFGVEAETALAFSLVMQGSVHVMLLLLAGGVLWQESRFEQRHSVETGHSPLAP